MNILQRTTDAQAENRLLAAGIAPLLARIYAARGVNDADALNTSLAQLIPPDQLTHNQDMANLLAEAIAQQQKILVIGDYDADGATATAVAVKGLRALGAVADFLVPNRFEYGYGLTPEIVRLAATLSPDIIVTVDNGIASVDGVDLANTLGIRVLVTDHHLPGAQTPAAACIVNPNQRGCQFPSKHLAGVGVMFYVLLALRATLRARGAYAADAEPNLLALLDLVALGTVADLVKLDSNNRILVEQGLRRIRAGACCLGIKALLQLSGRDINQINAQDLGFYVGPRLNAAGRLDDMRLGIQCLLSDDANAAETMAQTLHAFNAERRVIETDMQASAMQHLESLVIGDQFSISLYQPDWHQGVIGILASRIKERYHRPTIAFANAEDSADNALLKGSGRSIAGLHLRDALDLLAKRNPALIVTFGGHAMAAGLTIKQSDFLAFQTAFEAVVCELLEPADLQAEILSDGHLETHEMDLTHAQLIQQQVWGQGFAMPAFDDVFTVVNQRIVGEKHLKLYLEKQGQRFDAIYFGQTAWLPETAHLVYQLQINRYRGAQSVQLQVLHAQPYPLA